MQFRTVAMGLSANVSYQQNERSLFTSHMEAMKAVAKPAASSRVRTSMWTSACAN